ncbi:MAG TPA: molybdopterin molybdotransferase MoeA, partial [Thermomicrobiales bacterium]|nr:molybdopterin molybdotransferase MoeA [Thermomicrobiales bacterium]
MSSRPPDMLHPDTAREFVLAAVQRLPTEVVGLADLVGRVVAHEVVANDNHPPFPASTMDGYAISSEDVSPWREVTGVQIAGPDLHLEVFAGQTVKIMTGAPVPPGADAVVPIEDVELADDHIVMPDRVIAAGACIRPIGSDLRAGDVVIPAGTILGPVDIGLIATMGYSELSVSKRPRVAVISTGDELIEPGAELGPGMIRDSNRFALAAALTQIGAEVVHSSRVGDDVAVLAGRIASVRNEIDILVTSGGVSVGDKDVVRMMLGETADVKFRRLFMKPGKPLTFATDGPLMIFGLPGNPVASMVSLELFVRPAIKAMTGMPDTEPDLVPVTLATTVKRSDRLEFQRAEITVDRDGHLLASTTGSQISSRLASMRTANGLIVIDAGEDTVPAGTVVQCILI